MSQVPSVKGKGNANKPKFASFNISKTYVGTKLESKNTTGPGRHGMQVLGRVTKKVLAPAHLPSIKKENKGNDPSVNIVTSNSGWASKKENKEQTTKPEEQGPTSQKQAKVGQNQDISLRPNAGAGPRQGDGTKTWVSLQTSTGSTSQTTTTYFQKEFPKLGGEGEGGSVSSEKEPQEEKAVQQTRQVPPRFQSDQKFMDGHGAPVMPRAPMAFPPDQRHMFNGGPPLFNRPVMDAPYGIGPMPPGMFSHGYVVPMAGRFPFPFDPNYARGMQGVQRMPVVPQKAPVAQGERPLTVRDEDLQRLGQGDDDDGDGWAGDQEEVDYNAQLKFDDSDLEEEDGTKKERSREQSAHAETGKMNAEGRGTPDTKRERGSRMRDEEKAGSGDRAEPQKDDDSQGPPLPTQAWADMTPGFPGQVPGAPYNQGQWRGPYPPPPFDPSRPPPNYPNPMQQWLLWHSYGMAMSSSQQQQQPQPSQPPQQGATQQHPPVSVAPPAHAAAKAAPQASTSAQEANEGANSSKASAGKAQKRKEVESVAIQEARRRKQEEESRLEAERKAAAQAKLKDLEAKMALKAEKTPGGLEEKRVSESDGTERSWIPARDREESREEDSKAPRDRGDSEASDTSRASSQPRSERQFSKNVKEIAPRFQKQQQQQHLHRTMSSDEYMGVLGDENDYLNLPQAEGRASPPMSQSSDSLPVRRIMKRHDSARSDDASSVHSQDSWSVNPAALREGVSEGGGDGRTTDLIRHSKASSNADSPSATGHCVGASDLAADDRPGLRERVDLPLQEENEIDNITRGLKHTSLGRSQDPPEPAREHSPLTSAKSDEIHRGEEVDGLSVIPLSRHDIQKGKVQSVDSDSKRVDFKRHRDLKTSKGSDNSEYGKSDKYDRNPDKKNFKKLEKPTLKNNKVSGSKERLSKAEKEQVKRTNLPGEPKRVSAWAKVVAGEIPSGASGTGTEDKGAKEEQKNLNDIQREEEENERKEREKQRKALESKRDTTEDSKDDYSRREDSRADRVERGSIVERRESDRRKRLERDDSKGYDRSTGRGGYRQERHSYGVRNEDEKGVPHGRDRFNARPYKGQDQNKQEDSDENEDQQTNRRNSGYEAGRYRRNDRGPRERGPRVHERSRGKPGRGDKEDRDQDRTREKMREDGTRNDSGRRDVSGELKDGDKQDKHRDKGRGKMYGSDRHGDDYSHDSMNRRDRKPGYEGFKRPHEERKRKHDGGRADYKAFVDEGTNRDHFDGSTRDETRKEGKAVSQSEGRESRSGSSGQPRSYAGRGFVTHEKGMNRREGDKKGFTQKRRSGDIEGSSHVTESSEVKPVSKDKKEQGKRRGSEEDVEGEEIVEEEVAEDDVEYSAGESETEEGYSGSKTTKKIRERGEEDKKVRHDSRSSRERRGQPKAVSRPYSLGRASHRGYPRHGRTSGKDYQVFRKKRGEKGDEDEDEDHGHSEEEGTSEEEGAYEGDERDQSSSRYHEPKSTAKSSGRGERESYRRTSRGSRGMQERRWEKDQPPRFKKHALLNKSPGRGRDFSRGSGRGRGYASHGGSGRERNRGRGYSQGGTSYPARQQEEDWENESGESGTYHTAEENSASTSNQETHRKSAYSRGKGYSRGHASRGGQGGSHSTSQEDRQNHFLADRQQARVSQVGTSAQAGALPAAFDGPVPTLKDSEVRSSYSKMSVASKKSDKVDRSSQNTYNAVSSSQSREDASADNADEPPKKIPKNKSSMEIKRNLLKEFDVNNIASVVVIDDIDPNTEHGSTASNDDDGFVQVTSRKTQKELREKQREEVRKKQREESSQTSKSSKSSDKETSSKVGRQHKTTEIQAARVQTPVPTQASSSATQVLTTTQAQTSNAAMAAVGGWEPAQSLMRTSQIVATGNGLEASKSMTVPAPPPPVNAWQRPLNFTSSVGGASGGLNQSKTPDPKAVGTGKPSSSGKQAAVVNGIASHPVAPASAKSQMAVNVPVAVSQASTLPQPSVDRKTEDTTDGTSTKKSDSKKERSASGTLKGGTGTPSSKKIMSRTSALRDKGERSTREGKAISGRQPLVRREKLIDRKTKREKPPRFRNITKGRMSAGKESVGDDADVLDSERPPMSPLAEGDDKVVAGGSKLQGEDRAPGKRPQSFEGRNQIQSELAPNTTSGLSTTLTPASVSSTAVGGDSLARVSRSIPVQLSVANSDIRNGVVERSDEQLGSASLRKQSKDDGSSAEEEENAKDTARSVIKSLSDDDEKALETRSLPGTPPLAVEIPEPNSNGPSSDPGRTTSPPAPNSMAQEMSEMSKKVLFTKKLWDDDVPGSSVRLVGVAQSAALPTWSDGSESSQKVMKEITVASSQPSATEASVEKQSEGKEEVAVSVAKPEEKVAPTVSSSSAFGKKAVGEQQNVCKVKPQQQQIPPAETVPDPRGSGAPTQNQVITSQFLIPSPYTVPCQPATTQTAKVHQGYLLPVENLNAGLQQAFLTQSDSASYQELSQQQPISLNIHPVNQPSARSTSAIAHQQQQQQQEFMRPLVVNNVYGPPAVQGSQNPVLAWQVVTTHSAHTSSSVSFQSHLQGSHSGNAFSHNVTLANTPLFMTFDPQGPTNSSIFSTQRASSHLQQQPVGLVVQQPQSQTLPSYVGVIPGNHQSSHEHPFGVRTPHTKLTVGSSPLPSGQMHHVSSPLPLSSATLGRQLGGSDVPVHHLSPMSSGSGHHPIGQRPSQPVSVMSGLTQGITVPPSSIHLGHGSSQALCQEGHISSQSELMKHVNAKPFQPSSKTPPSTGISGQQSPGLSQVTLGAHHPRSSQNPLVAPVRPRSVQGRNIPSSSPTTVALQSVGRLGAVSPVDQGVTYIPTTMQVKGQHISSLTQHALPGGNVQHSLHPLQSQFPDHQAQIVGPSRAFSIHPTANAVHRFARPAPGPIQRPTQVNVVNGIVPPRPKAVVHHPQTPVNKNTHNLHQPSKGEHYQLSAQQPQEMFRSQQHQKMIEETKKFFQKENLSQTGKSMSREKSTDEDQEQEQEQDESAKFRGPKHDVSLSVNKEEKTHANPPLSSETVASVHKSVVSKGSIAVPLGPPPVSKSGGAISSSSDDAVKDDKAAVAKPQPQRSQERTRRAQRIGKMN